MALEKITVMPGKGADKQEDGNAKAPNTPVSATAETGAVSTPEAVLQSQPAAEPKQTPSVPEPQVKSGDTPLLQPVSSVTTPVAPPPLSTPTPQPVPSPQTPPQAEVHTPTPVSKAVPAHVPLEKVPVFDPKNVSSFADVILPQKNPGPSLLSAQRASAADVLAAADAALAASQPAAPKVSAMQPKPEARSAIPSMHTFKSDVEKEVQEKNISLADIATAQAHGRSAVPDLLPDSIGTAHAPTNYLRIAQIAGGILLLVAGFGFLGYILTTSESGSKPETQAPTTDIYIYVDATHPISVPLDTSPLVFKSGLQQLKESSNLSLGLIDRLYFIVPSSTPNAAPAMLDTPELFSFLAPNAPQELVRALSLKFLFGVHSFDGNQPFLLFKTDLYEQAFAGMLQWEPSMKQDLGPAFIRTPKPHISEEGTATSTASVQFLQTGFIDRIVENHNARVIENDVGDILLLWTFIDRNTLIITTNEYTLREVIARLAEAPIVSIPGN